MRPPVETIRERLELFFLKCRKKRERERDAVARSRWSRARTCMGQIRCDFLRLEEEQKLWVASTWWPRSLCSARAVRSPASRESLPSPSPRRRSPTPPAEGVSVKERAGSRGRARVAAPTGRVQRRVATCQTRSPRVVRGSGRNRVSCECLRSAAKGRDAARAREWASRSSTARPESSGHKGTSPWKTTS